jgi:hypothetical protein
MMVWVLLIITSWLTVISGVGLYLTLRGLI